MRIRSVFLSIFMFACSRAPETVQPAPSVASPASAPEKNAVSAAPIAVPEAPAPALSAVAEAGGLLWEHRAPLVRRKPKSSMRAAEYGVEGDANAELSVFFFGPNNGGDVESNMQRWVGQLRAPAGAAVTPKRSTKAVGPIAVHLVEAAGAFGGGMAMPGMPPAASVDDALMLGAIAEAPTSTPGEPIRVFFKLVGPRVAVERARPAFDALVDSLHAASVSPAAVPSQP
jgi:hypothetical protein